MWLKKETSRSLETPYKGPYQVLDRDKLCKTILLDKNGVHLRVSIDKVKPAWIFEATNGN